MSHAKPGDYVALGVCLSGGMEVTERAGRIVGIIHAEEGKKRFVMRAYRPGDGKFPTGRYYHSMFLVPHRATDDTCYESKFFLEV